MAKPAAKVRSIESRAVESRSLEYRNYINGEWVASTGTTLLDVENPATGEVLAKVPLSTAKDVDSAMHRNIAVLTLAIRLF